MPTPQRPLSPHLQIYKRQITSVLSILHRITGLILAFGAFGLAMILLHVSRNPIDPASQDVFSWVLQEFWDVFDSRVGLFLSVAFSWCLFYHLLNGIRHLFWDAGKGFEIKQFTMSGWLVVVLSFALTASLWVIALGQSGGMP
jgi:succinate dehydrogenase / fumarate reductase cytochrome b subunit